MKTTSTHSDLSLQIEHLVQAHLVAVRAEAEAAVGRAFAGFTSRRSRRPPSQRPSRSGDKRRTREEIDMLAERLVELVVDHPGAAMTMLAAELGVSPRELERPMNRLRRAGRVRSAGQRHMTRYFPLASGKGGN